MLKLNQNRHNPFNFCENRLIFKASRIEVLAQNTVDTIKENTPQTKDQLEKLLISIRVPDRAIFFSKFKEKVGSMNLIEIEAIETNLKSLETQITTGDIAQHIQSLKSVIDKQIETGKMAVQSNTTTATPNISNKPVLTKLWDATKQGAEKTRVAIISGAKSTGDFIENSTDAVLPKKWTLHMSRNQKIAIGIIGSAGTLIVGKWIYESGKKIGNGIGKLFGWGKESAEKGKEAAEKTKGGLFKKLLIGTGVGMAAFFGIDFLMKINGIKGMMDRMRNALTPKEKGESSEEEYGISNKEYNEAEQAYKVWNIKRIKEIFECNTGKETPEYLKFVGYMKNKYEVQIIDKLPYKKHEAAFEAYEDNMKSVFRIIKEKFEDRKYILAIGATIAWQTGILSILGETGITVANKSTELAKYLAKTTAKTAKNHPLIALLALGGGIATFYTIMKNNKNKNFLMPSNIPILIQALNIGTPFPYPSNQINIPKQLLADMKEYAASLSNIGSDIVQWTERHVTDILPLANEKFSNFLTLKKHELIADNHEQAFSDLEKYLKNKQGPHLNSPKAGPYSIAIEALQKYSKQYIGLHGTLVLDTNKETEEKAKEEEFAVLLSDFNNLKSALSCEEIGINLEIQNGKIIWINNDTDEERDLGVDPTIRDTNTIIEKSKSLDHGQGNFEFFFHGLVQKLGDIQQGNEENNEWAKYLTGSTSISIIIGNFLYVVEEWKSDTPKYFIAPLELLTPGGLFEERENWHSWEVSAGSSTAIAGIITLSTGAIAKIKRLAIGGGPIAAGRRKWLTTKALQINPISSPFVLVHRAKQTYYDSIVMKNVGKYLNLKDPKIRQLWSNGHYVNNRLRKIGIRPEWIRAVEDPHTSYETLQNIGKKTGIHNTMGVYDEVGYYKQKFWNAITLRKTRGLPTGPTVTPRGRALFVLELREHLQGKIKILRKVNLDKTIKEDVIAPKVLYSAVNQSLGGVPIEEVENIINNTDEITDLARGSKSSLAIANSTGTPKPKVKVIGSKPKIDVDMDARPIPDVNARPTVDTPSGAMDDVLGGGTTGAAGSVLDEAAEATSETTPAKLLDDPKWARVLDKFGNVDASDIRAILELAEEEGAIAIDKKTIALLSQSKTARSIMAGAVESGEVIEIARALQIAKKAAAMRALGNVAGAGLDAFGLAMAFIDWQANNEKIEVAKQTKNESLIKLYEGSKTLIITEGATSAVGLTIGGIAIIGTMSGGALAAAGATAGIVMLPIGIAVGVGGVVRRGLTSASETWLKDTEDWVLQSDGELFAELDNQKPGKGGSLWQWVATADDWIVNAYTLPPEEYRNWNKIMNRLEGANGGTRFKITSAIVQKSNLKPIKEKGESDEIYQIRIREWQQSISDQMLYIAQRTQGDFDTTNPDIFTLAAHHSDLMAYSRALRENSVKNNIKWAYNGNETYNLSEYCQLTPKERMEFGGTVLHTYIKEINLTNKAERLHVINKATAQSPAHMHVMMSAIQSELLVNARLHLAKMEAKIASLNFPDSWFDGWEKDSARVVLSTMYRKKLHEESKKLMNMDTITPESILKAQTSIEALLSDPVEYLRLENKTYEVGISEYKKAHASPYAGSSSMIVLPKVYKEKDPAFSLFLIAKYGNKIDSKHWFRESTIESNIKKVGGDSTKLTDIEWLLSNMYVPKAPMLKKNIKLDVETEDPPEAYLEQAA